MKLIKKIIYSIILLMSFMALTACGKKQKSREEKFEEKYDIEINNASDENLDSLEKWFSKLPEGFIAEIRKYQKQNNRTLTITFTDDTSEYNFDINKGDNWYINTNKKTDAQFSYCLVYTIFFEVANREKDLNFCREWDYYNPDNFSYGKGEQYKEYVFDKDNYENAYFVSTEAMKEKLEDAASIFIVLMLPEFENDEKLKEIPKIYLKAKYLCDEIYRVYDSVDGKAYWNRCFDW